MKKTIAVLCSVLALLVMTCSSPSGGENPDPEDPDPGTPSFTTMIQKILANDAQANDIFGNSVAISGNYAIVGAPYEDNTFGSCAGAVYIFHRTSATSWDSGVKIMAPDAQQYDAFGWSVAINGDYAIIGAPQEDGGEGDPLSGAGAAYIYHRTGTNTWDSSIKLLAPDGQEQDGFGWSVAISGDHAIVGAPSEDGGEGDPLEYAGAAYIYHRTEVNTWDSGVKVVSSDIQANDTFGWSVAINGDYAIVGALQEDGGEGNPYSNVGAAYIFFRTNINTWDEGVKVVTDDGGENDHFGCSVAIDDEYAIIGAEYTDYFMGQATGMAYVFHRTGSTTWDSGVKLVSTDIQWNDMLGYSVAISGEYALVGAYAEDGGAGNPINGAGAAYIFHRTDATNWDSGVKLMATDAQNGDHFGYSVAIDGDYAIVGAVNEDGDEGNPLNSAGAAYFFH